MKKLLFIIPLLFLISSCSNNSSGSNPTGTMGSGIIGGGGTGSVVWTMGQRAGDQGGVMLTANPSVAVTVTQVIVSVPANNFTDDPVQGDGQTVFQAGQFYDVKEYTGVTTGLQFSIEFKGNLGSATGTAYDVTSTYTAQ